MRSIRIFLIVVASLTLLAGFGVLGYHLFRKFSHSDESPINAIPGNTAMIIQLNQAGNLLGELNQSNLLWRSLSRFPGIQGVGYELNYLDSASRRNEHLNSLFHKGKVWIAITMSGKSKFGALYLASIGGHQAESAILEFVSSQNLHDAIIVSSPYSTTTLYRIQPKNGHQPFYFAMMKGVFTGSYHVNLVKRSLDRLSLNAPMAASAGFKQVEMTVGRKADANVYINYRFFSLLLSALTREETLSDLIRFSSFADWSGLDLIIKKDELLLNGITVASDSSQHFMSLFASQEPQKLTITRVIPSSANFFTAFGWSNPDRFSAQYQARITPADNTTPDQAIASRIIDQFELNINEYFLPWMGSEASVFGMDIAGNNMMSRIIALSASDTITAVKSLKALCDSIGTPFDSLSYRGKRLFLTNIPPFLSTQFGEAFGKVKINCFTSLKGFILFAANPEHLRKVIDDVVSGNTLSDDRNFNDFATNFPEEYNVFHFYNTRLSVNPVKRIVSQDIFRQFYPAIDSLKKIESLAFHFSNADGLFYSNFFLRYNPGSDEGPLLWQTALDTVISLPPRLIRLTNSGINAVVTADVNNTLYLIDTSGRILWRRPVMGSILGDIHAIRSSASDSLHLVFNTDTHLYKLHVDGTFADNYPMRFPINATNGLTLIPSGQPHGPNILVAFQDNRLYQFDPDGKSLPEWARPSPGEKISQPAVILRQGPNTYITMVGQTGKAFIADEHGHHAISLLPTFINSPVSRFYLSHTIRKGSLLTTSLTGKVVYITPKGKISEVTLNLFTPEHRFFYEDITGNGQPEFIFIDRNQIYYYNRNYNLIYSYAFRREINNDPFLLQTGKGKVLIGFVFPETNELMLFNHQGVYELEAGIRGNTRFDIGPLAPGKSKCLVVGQGKYLKCYRLAQL